VTDTTPPLVARRKALSRELTDGIAQNKALVLGLTVLLIIVLASVFGPFLVAHDPYTQDLTHRNVPPIWYPAGSWEHPLGTDPLGRDYLARTLAGGRISLLIGISVVTLSGLIGTALGLVAGFYGGRIDMGIMFIITTRLSIPVILVALSVVAVAGSSLWIVIVVLGLLKWDRFAVVVRSATQEIRPLDYIAAAEVSGISTARLIFREVAPNLVPQLIVVATLEAASAILLEAALSFLGLGVQPPLPSWGLMISEARSYMFFSFWLIAIPGTMLAVLILSINVTGDALRDFLSSEVRR
jgi:peptide/nickel transport system permease protein